MLARNSRWNREPILQDGRPRLAKLTDRDIEVLKLLARYTYLPLDDIHAFVGGSIKGLGQHLNLLSRKPNLYIARPQQQRQCADANSRPLIYELDHFGVNALRGLGIEVYRKKYYGSFWHELMVCRIMASIELGTVRMPSLRLIGWNDILAHPRTPAKLSAAQRPSFIPVSAFYRNRTFALEISADAKPFGIERTNSDGSKGYFFFPGIEADIGTEPIESTDLQRSSILRKFVAYRAIAEQRIYASHFGFPNFFVPFIATNEVRMRSMMSALSGIVGARGSAMFLFKVFPQNHAAERQSKEPGHMLLEPWQRVGFPPLSFIA